MINVFEGLNDYKEELTLLSKRLEKEMERLPKGRLRVAVKENRANYYQFEAGEGTSGTKGIYLGKKKEKTIRGLAHCGRMGDAEYTAKMVAKDRSYEKSGIYVGRNLYLTFETLETPFDAGSIETIFEQFA